MKLLKKNIAKFIHHTYAIEDLQITSTEKILEYIGHLADAKEVGLPPTVDYPQVSAHIEAIEYVKKNKARNYDFRDLRNLHIILMSDFTDMVENNIRTSNYLYNGVKLPDAYKVSKLMEEFLELQGKTPYKSWSKKKVCYYRHLEFEYIHPFVSGNGVLGRMIYLWDCLHSKTQMDIIEKKEEYINDLNDYRSRLRSSLNWK